MLSRLRALAARVVAHVRASSLDRDFEEELAAHEALLAAEHARRGLSAEEARRAARVQIGGATALRQAHRQTRGLPAIEAITHDVRSALRALRRDRGFATFAILVAGLGLGASVVVFSLLDAVVLRPLPFADADRLVWIGSRADNGVDEWHVQVANLLDLRDQSTSLVDIAGYYAYYRTGDKELTGLGDPERITAVPISQSFLPLLGVEPRLGRQFTSDECAWNGPRVVLLSHGFWVRRFGSDPDVLGRTLTMSEQSYTIVGVLPATFNFGAVFDPGRVVDVFTPYPLTPETSRTGNSVGVVGRLRPGVSAETARAELEVLGAQVTEQYRGSRNSIRPVVTGLSDRVSGGVRTALWLLALAVGVVMAIVCANLANLQLTRLVARQKELAVRVALGATRWHVARLLLTENVLVASGGALLGLALAAAGVRLVSQLQAFDIPLLDGVRLDATALAFLAAMTATTGLAMGVVPVLHLSAGDLHGALKDSARGTSTGTRSAIVRTMLVAAELALTCVLLVGAGLLLRSFVRVLDVDLGFRPESVSALRIDAPRGVTLTALAGRAWDDAWRDVVVARNAYYDEVLRRTREIADVRATTLTITLPLGGESSRGVAGIGQVFPDRRFPQGFYRVISDGYLETMGAVLVAGRDILPTDTLETEPVVLVNETLAQTLWPGQDAVGQRMLANGVYNTADSRRVVGVVRDIRHRALERAAGGELYVPIRQTAQYDTVYLVVRSSLPPRSLATAVRDALAPVATDLLVHDWQPLQQLVDKASSPRRFVVTVLASFAAAALLLAALGIYGVVSYSVSQRTAEFGIRLALGATPRELSVSVVRATLWLASLGIIIGVGGAVLASRMMTALLFDVSPGDPATFLATLVLLVLVTALAGYVPARRAARVDAMTALRGE